MNVTNNITLADLRFRKQGCFPESERKRIVAVVKSVNFKDFQSYKRPNGFEEALTRELGDEYTYDTDTCRAFKKKQEQKQR